MRRLLFLIPLFLATLCAAQERKVAGTYGTSNFGGLPGSGSTLKRKKSGD